MNTSHTPGPWKVKSEQIDPEWAIVEDNHGNIVANVNSETGPALYLDTTKMPKDANAHLIAAAPELLAALHAARECLKIFSSGNEKEKASVLSNLKGPASIMPQLDRAIAKTEGREI